MIRPAEAMKALIFTETDWDTTEYQAVHSDGVDQMERAETIELYLPHVQSPVLDWGCCACLDGLELARRGHKVEACDIMPRAYSGDVPYTRLEHAWKLPYVDEAFRTVIGSGVIEHVPFIHRSLEELWRILRPGGKLVLTYAPRRYGIVEAILRWTGKPAHRRRFTRRSLRQLCESNCFDLGVWQTHAATPMLCSFRNGATLALRDVIPRQMWRVGPISQNAMAVATKTLWV